MRRHFDGEHAVVDGQPEVLFHERFDCVGRRDPHAFGTGHDHAVDTLVLGLQHVGQVAHRVGHRAQRELTEFAPGWQRNRDPGQSTSDLNVNFCNGQMKKKKKTSYLRTDTCKKWGEIFFFCHPVIAISVLVRD